ncbi:MAG: hypothetical protein QM479_03670 [Pseudomonadota bacterium]
MLKSFKMMMNGLSAQYAGDYLSSSEKEKFIIQSNNNLEAALDNKKPIKQDTLYHKKRHIARFVR